MQMEMPDRLAGTGAIIQDETIIPQFFLDRQHSGDLMQVSHQRLLRSREIGMFFNMSFWNYKDMNGCLGVDVAKGNGFSIFVN